MRPPWDARVTTPPRTARPRRFALRWLTSKWSDEPSALAASLGASPVAAIA
jgi:hypothetical protein